MQKVLQLLIDFCQDSISALDLIPAGEGETLIASSVDGEIKTKRFTPPVKLSDYWNSLYDLAAKLQCCENFLSASKPSAPCLMCHPFGESHVYYKYNNMYTQCTYCMYK